MSQNKITKWIEGQPQLIVVLFAMFAAFAAYLSMYAFRKPLAANSYEGVEAFSLFGTAFHYKAIALISQLLGYMCSKFLGVKFASEAPLSRRAPYVLGLILFAWLMLVLFALTPALQRVLDTRRINSSQFPTTRMPTNGRSSLQRGRLEKFPARPLSKLQPKPDRCLMQSKKVSGSPRTTSRTLR